MHFPMNLQPSLPLCSHAEPELFPEQLAAHGPLGPQDRRAAPEGAPSGAQRTERSEGGRAARIAAAAISQS